MFVYYLKNRNKGEDKYYTASNLKDMERDATSNNLSEAAFYLDPIRAAEDIPEANNWWSPHDFVVEKIDFNVLKQTLKKKKISVIM